MKRALTIAIVGSVACTGCITHAVRVEPITIAPLHVTMDVNLHVDDAPATEPSQGAEVTP